MLSITKESPARVFIGEGTLKYLADAPFTGKGIIVTTAGLVKRGQLDGVFQKLNARGLTFETLTTHANPTLVNLDSEIERLRIEGKENPKQAISWVAGIGGGSTLDSAKVFSLMLAGENLGKSLTSVATGKVKMASTRLPLWLSPTTAGTGAEITPFATVWDMEKGKKLSLSQDVFTPETVLLDSNLTKTAPRNLAISCALDTCSHAMESLWNKNATERSASYAHESLRCFLEAFPKILFSEDFSSVMATMQRGSFWGGMAIRLTRTAISHAISYPVTLHYGAPHGIACSFTLLDVERIVSRENAWFKGADRELIAKVVALLEKADLHGRVARYATAEEIRALKGEMFTPGRSDNFVLGMEVLEEILG